MQNAPQNWDALFASSHKTEYKLVIDGVDYTAENLQGDPKITKPLLNKPEIGRVCSTTMTAVIRPKSGVTIPKAARAYCFCRLTSPDGQTATDWIPQGAYFVCSRSGKTNIALTLRDDMVKAGQTYYDKTSIKNWPCQQETAVADIAALMGVEVDSRTELATGSAYRVNYLEGDTLISEVLSYIAASNGGNWIMTEEGKLRLVKLSSPEEILIAQDIGNTHGGYTETGVDVTISRITMTDDSDTLFTAGNDSGLEITVASPFANQEVVNDLAASLSGVIYRPHRIDKVRLNPLVELGDTLSVKKQDGTIIRTLLYSAVISCNVGYTASLAAEAAQDAEEEFPYKTAQELQAGRSVRTDRTYYGTSLNKGSGLVIRRIKGETEQARVTFNADEMAFYQGDKQVLYFDAVNQKWTMSAEMEVKVENADGSYSNLNVLAQGLSSEIRDVNGKALKIEQTVDGLTVTDEKGNTLINGGSVYTDNLFLSRLFSRSGDNSYIEMLENGLNFILGQKETIGIGYYSSDVPLPYMVFGAGSSPQSDSVGMVKKYANGIWIGDSADRYSATIEKGTGLFVETATQKIYKYINGFGVEFADTSNVVAVFG